MIVLRAMNATGMSQRQIAGSLGISQPAVSQQLALSSVLDEAHPQDLLDAAAPILKVLAEENGYSGLAVFGSVAHGRARQDSDIDLLVEAPRGTSSFGFVRFKQLIEQVIGRKIDLVPYGGLTSRDADIVSESVPL
ncbi:MAG: nucleotidyltransferase domain-containing protein [Gulosibacter sp.]|uniref:nucleotidyltransferase family protein n=1 Tax=Gulosibacter sp. TaxID=2817531 RepID=UPI003F92507C